MADAYFAAPVPSAPAAPGRAAVPYPPPFAAPLLDLTPVPDRSHAVRTTALCIAAGAASQGIYWLLTRNVAVEPEAAVRYAFVTTLGVYAVVAAILLHAVPTPLDWRAGAWSVPIGLGLGGGLAYVLLRGDATNAGDPRLALMVSEGSFANIAATVVIAVVAAPLCEEVLFRGLLLRSIELSGRRKAVWLSAVAFAAWHLMPMAMPYYTLFGAVFGALYLRRGLACSIAAHAAFNGMLVVVAVGQAFGPGVTVSGDGLVVAAPPGWHATGGLDLRGPSGAQVLVQVLPDEYGIDPDLAAEHLSGYTGGDGRFEVDHARAVRLPIADAVRVRVHRDGRDGELVIFTAGSRVYGVELLSGGSPRVRADFDKMLRDLRLAS